MRGIEWGLTMTRKSKGCEALKEGRLSDFKKRDLSFQRASTLTFGPPACWTISGLSVFTMSGKRSAEGPWAA